MMTTAPQKKQNKAKTVFKKITSIILFILMLLSFINGVSLQETHSISQFETGHNVFIQKQGKGALINGHWKLITYMDLSEYKNEYNTLHKNINVLRKNCENGMCTNMMQEIDDWVRETDMYDEIIEMKLQAPQKRSFGTFAYSLLGSIFGYVGSKIIDTITSNDNNEEKTNEMLNKQISVLKLAHEEIAQIDNATKTLGEKHWDLSYVLLTLIKFHNKQRTMLNAVTNSKLDIDWLRPDELQYQIDLISQNLPNDMALIGSNDNAKLLATYQFAKMKTATTTNTLISVIEIPLIEKTRFDHSRLITLPFEHEGKFMAPMLKNNHVWINADFSKLFSEKEISDCINFEDELICKNNAPLWLNEKMEECEWQIYMNKTTSKCEYQLFDKNEYWIKLQNNEWLFSVVNESIIRIECEKETIKIKINGTGSIKLNESCQIITQTFRLSSNKEITTNDQVHMVGQMHNIVWPGKLNAIAFKEKLLETINLLQTSDDISFMHHMHHYISIYTTMIVVIFIVCYFYSKLEIAPAP